VSSLRDGRAHAATKYGIAQGARDDMPPRQGIGSALVRVRRFSRNKDLRLGVDPTIAANLLPSADWWPAVAKLQAMGQTDGRIALFQNAPRAGAQKQRMAGTALKYLTKP